MRWLPGGRFRMGSNDFYPEERPVRTAKVKPFWIDEAPVTNAQFKRFVAETAHVTLAEIAPDPADYPGLSGDMARAGSLVFRKTAGPVDMHDVTNWWKFEFGADWRRPLGPGSSIDGLDDHPVVHVAYQDAEAYSRWAGKEIPTEIEWEYAARGGLDGADYAWGGELAPGGTMMANYWQGLFPFANQLLDGFEGTSPVRTYPRNGYGLYDMIGNVWEWTSDCYEPRSRNDSSPKPGCCGSPASRGGANDAAGGKQRAKVVKGGSHLCAPNYCRRYRPAARQPQTLDTATTHIGFRCVVRC
jgi:sulfatase modifying factor 1